MSQKWKTMTFKVSLFSWLEQKISNDKDILRENSNIVKVSKIIKKDQTRE